MSLSTDASSTKPRCFYLKKKRTRTDYNIDVESFSIDCCVYTACDNTTNAITPTENTTDQMGSDTDKTREFKNTPSLDLKTCRVSIIDIRQITSRAPPPPPRDPTPRRTSSTRKTPVSEHLNTI